MPTSVNVIVVQQVIEAFEDGFHIVCRIILLAFVDLDMYKLSANDFDCARSLDHCPGHKAVEALEIINSERRSEMRVQRIVLERGSATKLRDREFGSVWKSRYVYSKILDVLSCHFI